MKPKLIICIGIPASGKSTWSNKFVEETEGWIKTARDDFRYGFQNKGLCDTKIEDLISKCQDFVAMEALEDGINVIIDNTNIKKIYLDHWNILAEGLADVYYKIFPISLTDAQTRNNQRERKVPTYIIDAMYKSYEKLISDSDYDFENLPKWI